MCPVSEQHPGQNDTLVTGCVCLVSYELAGGLREGPVWVSPSPQGGAKHPGGPGSGPFMEPLAPSPRGPWVASLLPRPETHCCEPGTEETQLRPPRGQGLAGSRPAVALRLPMTEPRRGVSSFAPLPEHHQAPSSLSSEGSQGRRVSPSSRLCVFKGAVRLERNACPSLLCPSSALRPQRCPLLSPEPV